MTDMLSDTEIAFLAGIIDARGHIEVGERHGFLQPRLAVTTRRTELLDYLCMRTGTSKSDEDRPYERRPCGSHCTDAHQHVVRQSAKWRVDSGRATVVLWNVKPYIVSQRAEVLRALRIGMDAWPPRRGNTGTQMLALGWALPELS